MKKILAAVAILFVSASAMFAEIAVGAKGILGVGPSVVGDLSNMIDRLASSSTAPSAVVNGGFGIGARMGKGGGFLIGFQPELNFVFGRADKYTDRSYGVDVPVATSYNTLDIPLMLYIGGRIKNKVDITFIFGPQLSFTLGKGKNIVDAPAPVGKTETEVKLGAFGIGGVTGLEFAYNITDNHSAMFGYRFGYGVFLGDDVFGTSGSSNASYSIGYIDAAQFSLGYRYRF